MIVKKIRQTKDTKPKAWQIGDLVDYIRFPHGRNPGEKIAYAGGRNFLCSTHAGQKMEMIALARESVRSRMPVQHWVFSWKEGEQPTHEQIEEVVDIFLERMGLNGHQTVYGLHQNTENYHLHIAVNRMNAESGKVVLPHNGFDIREAHKILAIIEHRQGWESEDKALYTVLENGEVAERRMKRERKPKAVALDFENRTGEKSAQRIAQERGHSIIKEAKNWAELHERLAEVGLRFEKKGSGAVVFVGEIAVKASTIDRAFSMSKLCKRLGNFEAGQHDEKIPKEIPPEPVSTVNLEQWQLYQQERAQEKSDTRTRTKNDAEIIRLKERQREKRKAALSNMARYGLPILNIARHCLKVMQDAELRELRERLKTVCRRGARHGFEAWLRARGMATLADRWRYRADSEKRHTPRPPVRPEVAGLPQAADFLHYAEAVGADRYRVTCINMPEKGEKKTFILDKRDGQSRGFTQDELLASLPSMLRLQRRGENIYYTPLSEGKHHILIDDMTRESVMRLQKDGFRPAAILESSPGNFQCLLTIPKLGTPHDRDVGNRLTERLNRAYGDPKLCGCIHPHRAPGFENWKPKHRQSDGQYPPVKLLFAARRECRKAQEVAMSIDQEYASATRQAQRQTARPMPSQSFFRPGSAVSAYQAHFDNIRSHLTIEDFSRVDAMIALRMRANGHSREAVAEAIQSCAPQIRETSRGRNWAKYAERTAAYAFGPAGDRDMARYERYQGLWRKIESGDTERRRRQR